MSRKPLSEWPPGSVSLGTEVHAFILGRLEEMKIPAKDRSKIGAHAAIFAFVLVSRAANRTNDEIAQVLREMADLAGGGVTP